MKTEYVQRKLHATAAKIMTKMSTYDKREFVSLLLEQGEDFRALKRVFFDESLEADRQTLREIVLPRVDLQAEIYITDFTKKLQDFYARKARLAVVQELKRENRFVAISEKKGGKFDNVSEMSYESKGASGISVVTGASTTSKKMKKPKNLSKRNVQENSPFEEEFLVEKLNELRLEDEEVRQVGHLCDCLLQYGFVEKCRQLVQVVGE